MTPASVQSPAFAREGGRLWLLLLLLLFVPCMCRADDSADLEVQFRHPPESARPWVFWYWMQGNVSREGITADLEAMKDAGIGGAYLMPIQGPSDPPLMKAPVNQLTPEFWDMVRFAVAEAGRFGLKIGMHACDGFAVAGGPWITPELSMQMMVWTKTNVSGGRRVEETLAQPETREGYYRDIAVLAFPTPEGTGISTRTRRPKVTTSVPGADASFLIEPGNKRSFRSEQPCWIQYAFDEPFTCRSIVIRPSGNNFQSKRLLVEVSDDGKAFHKVERLEPPRHGWQDAGFPLTYAIEPTTARFFRFVYDKAGSEPGSEDLDSAKWKPVLKIEGLELSSAPRINQFEGKSARVWRVASWTTAREVPADLCVPLKKIVNLSDKMDAEGHLNWDAPAGQWTILRLGHTSTGQRNDTGGGGKGLECDKFSGEAARVQFDRWFGEALRQVGPESAGQVLDVFHADSWECGSQNWSSKFRDEFIRRRDYDLLPYLPAMAGIPVESADVSERFLHDLRQTIAELVVDRFYGTMRDMAHHVGCRFTGECTAPTMVGDGMMPFRDVDTPMGEFWLRSPTHDKPNDMLDAISGAHIYGKPIVQAEAFTELRIQWDETPDRLKPLADRSFGLGINRLVYHVFTENPWLDRQPGMTLNGVGLYFQRDQTWWQTGARAWVDYARRCQALLQQGRPVVDVAVFTGEEIPRRAVLPERLVSTLPGLFGEDVVEADARRLANDGEPQREMPEGVRHSANMADPGNWTDPLRGYAYDSINRDALLRSTVVIDGRIQLPHGASYGVLVVPGKRRMSPDDELMSPEVAQRLQLLVEAGATVIVVDRPTQSPSLTGAPACDARVRESAGQLWPVAGNPAGVGSPGPGSQRRVGAGRVVVGPFSEASFASLGIERDLQVTEGGRHARDVAWTHRRTNDTDIYFIANQLDKRRTLNVSLRVTGRLPEFWDPVSGEIREAGRWRIIRGRTVLPLRLEPDQSLFVVLRTSTDATQERSGRNWTETRAAMRLKGPWKVAFDPHSGGPEKPVLWDQLEDWSSDPDPAVRFYSGTASYTKTFSWKPGRERTSRVWLDLGRVENLGLVTINGIDCGTAWTAPYRVDITEALHAGENELRIQVTNPWYNRLVQEASLPKNEQTTWMNAPNRLKGKRLLPAGLLGPVSLLTER